jgi:glycosyltransferase involved in cell wall biosynthesis
MAERMRPRVAPTTPIHVIPPWPLFTPGELDPNAGRRFRDAHGLRDKRVLMFSGNLSPHHPIDTLLHALPAFAADERFACVFIGGGGARREVEQFVRQRGLPNVLMLPYQPMAGLVESLSAADVHLVSMGEAMVGIVHPSKIYSALAVGRPILALGPRRCHIAALVHEHHVGWHVEHGDVEGAVRALRELIEADATQHTALRQRAHAAAREHYNQDTLMLQFRSVVTAG